MDPINILLDVNNNNVDNIKNTAIKQLIEQYDIFLDHFDIDLIFQKFRDYISFFSLDETKRILTREFTFVLSKTLKENKDLFIAILLAIEQGYFVNNIRFLIDSRVYDKKPTIYYKIGYSYTCCPKNTVTTVEDCVYCDLYEYNKFDINSLNITIYHRRVIEKYIAEKNGRYTKAAIKK
jgi:hypothetical protein